MEFIPISQPTITEKEIEYVNNAIRSGWVSSLGAYIDAFENEFANYCGSKYALTTSNGTVALHLALVSLGIGPNDEVIVPDMTFVATANAVKYTGARVVLADIDMNTYCICPFSVEKLLTERTKAIIPVHLYGHPADMDAIMTIAKANNLFVIEDSAEAHGAMYKNQKVGAIGDVGVFSFYGNKIITSGEGGMVVTDDYQLYSKMKHLRDHAMSKDKRYWHTDIGFNYRMTNLQAALGLAQLERIDEIIEKRDRIYEWYSSKLRNQPGLKLNLNSVNTKSVYWLICLEISYFSEEQRDDFIKLMKNKNIDSRPFFYPISDMPMYEYSYTPIAHQVYKLGINLPSYHDLEKPTVDRICEEIIRILQSDHFKCF